MVYETLDMICPSPISNSLTSLLLLSPSFLCSRHTDQLAIARILLERLLSLVFTLIIFCFVYSTRYPETCKPLLKCHILSIAVLPLPTHSAALCPCQLNSACIHLTSSDLLYILLIAIYLFLHCLLP